MERLTEWIGEGEDRYAVPRMDLRKNGHQKCCNKLAEYEDLEEAGIIQKWIPVKWHVVDGFYFGWSAGCPRYCHYDGIHGTTIDTSEEDCYAVHGANSKEEAIEIWNNRVEHLKELDQQKGCKKIFEEMQKNQLR